MKKIEKIFLIILIIGSIGTVIGYKVYKKNQAIQYGIDLYEEYKSAPKYIDCCHFENSGDKYTKQYNNFEEEFLSKTGRSVQEFYDRMMDEQIYHNDTFKSEKINIDMALCFTMVKWYFDWFLESDEKAETWWFYSGINHECSGKEMSNRQNCEWIKMILAAKHVFLYNLNDKNTINSNKFYYFVIDKSKDDINLIGPTFKNFSIGQEDLKSIFNLMQGGGGIALILKKLNIEIDEFADRQMKVYIDGFSFFTSSKYGCLRNEANTSQSYGDLIPICGEVDDYKKTYLKMAKMCSKLDENYSNKILDEFENYQAKIENQ